MPLSNLVSMETTKDGEIFSTAFNLLHGPISVRPSPFGDLSSELLGKCHFYH